MDVGRRARWGAVRPRGGAAAASALLAAATMAGPSWPWLSLLSLATPLLLLLLLLLLGAGAWLWLAGLRARAAIRGAAFAAPGFAGSTSLPVRLLAPVLAIDHALAGPVELRSVS